MMCDLKQVPRTRDLLRVSHLVFEVCVDHGTDTKSEVSTGGRATHRAPRPIPLGVREGVVMVPGGIGVNGLPSLVCKGSQMHQNARLVLPQWFDPQFKKKHGQLCFSVVLHTSLCNCMSGFFLVAYSGCCVPWSYTAG